MDTVSTINGNEAGKVLENLTAPIPEKLIEYDMNGHPFISYYVMKNRIDEVVGVGNYDFLAPSSRVVEIGNDKWIMVTGTLVIKDDNRKAIKTVSVDGAERITIVESGNVQNLANSAENAWQNAFVKCMKCLSAPIAKQLSDIRNGKAAGTMPGNYSENNHTRTGGGMKPRTDLSGVGKLFPTNQSNNANSDGSREGGKKKRVFNCTLKTALTHFNLGYKAEVYCDELGGVYPFRMFSEAVTAVERYMPISDFVSQCQVGTQIQFVGFVNNYNGNEQVVMESVVP